LYTFWQIFSRIFLLLFDVLHHAVVDAVDVDKGPAAVADTPNGTVVGNTSVVSAQ
jgi:hypothetical protein